MPDSFPDQPLRFATATLSRPAIAPFLAGSAMVADAAMLARDHGADAPLAAALRAAQSRARDNVAAYCHWREVERLIGWLDGCEPPALVH